MPADELAERHTRLEDLWGRAGAPLRERLADLPAPEQRLDLFESMLAARLPRARALQPAVAQALEQFVEIAAIPTSRGPAMPPANPADRQLADDLRDALLTLLRELLSGPADTGAFVLNRGDRGLLASLDALSAEMASAQPGGRSSVAAHVDHLRYGIELLNRWARGDDPWSTANYGASWQRQLVSEAQWSALRVALADEARAWMAACGERREWDKQGVTEALASVVHLAYHVGAIRQLAHAASGPAAAD